MTRPAPYPADTKAKGWRFELDYEAIEQSDTWSLAAEIPMAQHALLMMWLVAWTQIPCGSLPADESIIRAKCKVPAKDWARVRETLMRGWWLAEDGRLYHDTIAQRVQEMLDYRRKEADRRSRNRHKSPEEPATIPPLSRGTDAGHPAELPGVPDTGTGTYIPEPDKPGPGISARADANGDFLGAAAPAQAQAAPAAVPMNRILASQVTFAMRKAGMADTNPSHPKLQTLIESGATVEEFVEAAKKAVAGGKGFGYALAIVEGQRKDAAALVGQLHTGPLPAKPAAQVESFRERDQRTAANAVAAWAPRLAAQVPGAPIEHPRNILKVEPGHVPAVGNR